MHPFFKHLLFLTVIRSLWQLLALIFMVKQHHEVIMFSLGPVNNTKTWLDKIGSNINNNSLLFDLHTQNIL